MDFVKYATHVLRPFEGSSKLNSTYLVIIQVVGQATNEELVS